MLACPCGQENVKLACDGFLTVEDIDPLTLIKSGDEFLMNHGSIVVPFTEIGFKYASDSQFSFKPLSSDIDCNRGEDGRDNKIARNSVQHETVKLSSILMQ